MSFYCTPLQQPLPRGLYFVLRERMAAPMPIQRDFRARLPQQRGQFFRVGRGNDKIVFSRSYKDWFAA